jgi:hypothetical protein
MVAYHTYLRSAFRHERLPAAALWLMASDATSGWLRRVAKTFAHELDDRDASRRLYDVLATTHDWLPARLREPEAVGRMMSGLYPAPSFARIAWLLDDVGGPAAGALAKARSWRWARRLSFEQRWHECATHLGELLIVLTEELPRHGVSRSPALLGQLCFDMGASYADSMKRSLKLPDAPASAIEVLRMGEYIFRVNPEHEESSDAEARTGYIIGNACPWYVRPGWGNVHCGIFGQFQSGISSAFGLSYKLTKTIPRHGGNECRIDLRPLRIRRKRSDETAAAVTV